VTVDLVQWLTACLDEDERIARAACEGGEGRWHPLGDRVGGSVAGDHEGYHVAFGEGYPTLEQATHIAAHDPARVLREVETVRRIVGLHVITVEKADLPPFDSYTGERNPDEYNVTCAICGWVSDEPTSACLTLRLLALPYADRDSYRPEWAPTE
jgi:hypothetical protein